MADEFDFGTYLANRAASGKQTSVYEATQRKIEGLRQIHQNRLAAAERDKDSWVTQLGLSEDSAMGIGVNALAHAYNGIGTHIVGPLAALPSDVQSAYYGATLDAQDNEAYNRKMSGTATPADIARLNQREIAPGEFLDPAQHAAAVAAGAREGGNTKLDLFNKAIAARTTSRNIVESFDRSALTHKGATTGLQNALADGSKFALDEVSAGWEDLKRGDLASGAGNVVAGVAQLVVHAADAAMKNKVGVLDYVAENGPQLLLGIFGKVGASAQALSNVGYAVDLYQQGVENIMQKTGKMPTTEQQNTMALQAAKAGLAEQAGDLIGVGAMKGRKALGAVTGAAEQQSSRAGFKESLKGIIKGTAEGTISEAPTEGYQTYLEGEITGKPASAQNIYTGAAIGGMSGAVLSGGMRTMAEVTQSTPEAQARREKLIEERTNLRNAIANNDTSTYLDPESVNYNPAKAVQVLHGNSALKTTTEETKQVNLKQVQEITTNLQDTVDDARDLNRFMKMPQADKEQVLQKRKDEIAALDPANTVAKQILEKQLTSFEAVAGPVSERDLKRNEADLRNRVDQLKTARSMQEDLISRTQQVTTEEVKNHVAVANTIVDPKDTEAVAKVQKSVSTLINLSMGNSSHITPEEASNLARNQNNTLTEQQRTYLREFSKARIAENSLMNTEKVSKVVLTGDGGDNYGITDYRTKIGQALQTDDRRGADHFMKMLETFTTGHANKADAFESALSKVRGFEPIQVVASKTTGVWFINIGEKLDNEALTANGGANIHKGTKKLVDAVRMESNALKQALAEQKAAYSLKYDNKGVVAPTVASTPSVVASVEPTVLLPIGTSGSGKSTWIKSLPQDNLVVISPDEMRVEFTGDMNDKSKDEDIYTEVTKRVITAIAAGKTVVLDSTNLQKDRRRSFITAIKTAVPGVNIKYNLMPLNPELAKQRIAADIKAGVNRANVPDSTIDRHTALYNQMLEDIKTEGMSMYQGTTNMNMPPAVPSNQANTAPVPPIQQKKQSNKAVYAEKAIAMLKAKEAALSLVDPDSMDLTGKSPKQNAAEDALQEVIKKVLRISGEFVNRIQVFGTNYAKQLQDVQKDLEQEFESDGNIYTDDLIKLLRDTLAYMDEHESMQGQLFEEDIAVNAEIAALVNKIAPNQVQEAVTNVTTQTPEASNGNTSQKASTTGTNQTPVTGTEEKAAGTPESNQASKTSETSSVTPKETNAQTPETKQTEQNQAEETTADTPRPNAGALSLFSQAVKVASGSMLDLYKNNNIVAQFFKQTGKTNPIVQVKDFFEQWVAGTAYVEDFLNLPEGTTLTEQENTSINSLYDFATRYMPRISKSFKELTWKEKEGETPFKKGEKDVLFKSKDMMQYFYTNGDVESNVKFAMVTAMYSWIQNQAGAPALLRNESIAKMHGKDKDNWIHPDGQAALQVVAGFEEKIANRIGEEVLSILGFKEEQNAPKDLKPRLVTAFGTHVLEALVEARFVSRVRLDTLLVSSYFDPESTYVPFEDREVTAPMVDPNNPDEMIDGVPKKTKEERLQNYYIKFNYVETEQRKYDFTPEVREIKDAAKGSQNVLSRIFETTKLEQEALTEPSKFNQPTAKRTDQKIPRVQASAIDKVQHQPHSIIDHMLTVVNGLGREAFLQISGHKKIDAENPQWHIAHVHSIEAQNNNLERQYDDAMNSEDTLSSKDHPRFVLQQVWKNFRAGFKNSTLNQQTSKIHRALFARPSWTVELKFNDNEKVMNEFLVAIAMMMGEKTDQKLNAVTLPLFYDNLDGVPVPKDAKIKKALNALRDALTPEMGRDTLWTPENIQAVVEATEKEGALSLQALTAYAAFMNAKEAGEDSVTISLLVGVDGKTNGPMLTLLSLGAGDYSTYYRGGFFNTDEGAPKHFSEYFSRPGSRDLYQDRGAALMEDAHSKILDKAKVIAYREANKQNFGKKFWNTPSTQEEFDALQVITKDLGTGTTITKAVRDLVKVPITAFFFGSSLKSAVVGMQSKFIDDIYTTMEDIKQGKRTDIDIRALWKALNVLIKQGNSNQTIDENTSLDDALQSLLTKNQEKALRRAFEIQIGNSVRTTFKSHFASFIYHRDSINSVIQSSHAIYLAVREQVRNLEIARLTESGVLATRTTKKGLVEHIQDLTKEQEAYVDLRVKDLLPVMHSAMSLAEKNLEAGLYMGKTETDKSNLPLYTNNVNTPNGNRHNQSIIKKEISIGIGGLAASIHSLDSTTIHQVIDERPDVLSVHDEAATGIDKIVDTAMSMNEKVVRNLLDYSPAREAYNMLSRMYVGLANRIKGGTVDAATLTAVTTALAEIVNFGIYNEDEKITDPVMVLELVLQKAFNDARSADMGRLATLSTLGYTDQYTWENGQYEVPDTIRKSAKYQLDNLPKEIDVKTAAALALLVNTINPSVNAAPKTDLSAEATPANNGNEDPSEPIASLAELKIQNLPVHLLVELTEKIAPAVAAAIKAGEDFLTAAKKEDTATQAKLYETLSLASSRIDQSATSNSFGVFGTPTTAVDPKLATLLGKFEESNILPANVVISYLEVALRDNIRTVAGKTQRYLLETLKKIIPHDLTIHYVTRDTKVEHVLDKGVDGSRGWYVAHNDGKEGIYVLGSDFKDAILTPEVFTHEILHAVLAQTIYRAQEEQKGPAYELVQQLETILEKVREATKKSNKYSEATRNVHELVSWGMTNRDFQTDVLMKVMVPVSSKGTGLVSLVTGFISTITQIIFNKKDVVLESAMSQVIAATSGLMKQAAIDRKERATTKRNGSAWASSVNLSMAKPLNTYTTSDVYAALDTGAISPEFDTHLQGIIQKITDKLHGPMGKFKESISQATVKNEVDVFNMALATGVAPFAFKALASPFKFSNQEAFVAEMVAATIEAAMDSNPGDTSSVYSELRRQYADSRAALTPADFDADPAIGKAKYDFIFNRKDTSSKGMSQHLAQFAAMGIAHEGFNKMLLTPSKKAPTVLADKTFLGALRRVFEKVLEFFNGKMTHTYAGQPVNSKLTSLVGQLVAIENKRLASLEKDAGSLVDSMDEGMEKLTAAGREKISAFGKSKFFKKSKNGFLRGAGAVVSVMADDRVTQVMDGITRLRNEHFTGIEGVGAGLMTYMRGPKQAFGVLLQMRKHTEGVRKSIISGTTQTILESFLDKGENLSHETKGALTATLLRTGAHILLGTYSLQDIHGLVSDSAKRKAAIAKEEKLLNQFDNRFRDEFKDQSRVLGYFLATGKVHGQHLLKNADNIAKMYGTTLTGRLTDQQTKDATQIIDRLSTLHAINYLSNETRRLAAETMLTENGRATGTGNGVEAMLKLHKFLEKDSYDRLFGGNTALMSKGYTPEIYNPHTGIQVANQEEGDKLVELGYVKVDGVLNQDPEDLGAEAQYMYSLQDGGLPPWVSGALSLTGMRAQGTKMLAKTAHAQQRHLRNVKQAAWVSRSNPGQFDPSAVKHGYLAPVLNEAGVAVNYAYLMQDSTKDTVLQRNNSFDEVLGMLAGNIYDKESTAEHNGKVIKALHDEYMQSYSEDPNAFVIVGPMSSDPELVELYQMMPQVTKDSIKEVWGGTDMRVRADMLDINFGYRKLTLSTAFAKAQEDKNALEQLGTFFIEGMLNNYGKVMAKRYPAQAAEYTNYGKRAAVMVRRGERMWQAVIAETKDNIVVKSGTTLLGNTFSNFTLLKLWGVSNAEILKYHQVAYKGAEDYQRDNSRLMHLEMLNNTGYILGDKSEMLQEIAQLKDALARNPVRDLIERGLMPSIVEDVDGEEDIYSYKAEFARKTEKFTSRLNNKVIAVANTAYMAHDTQMYKTLSHLTQLSDFTARYTLYQHLTNRKKNPLSVDAAVKEATDSFVNYDIPMHRAMQYSDDMGFTMFTKYFLSIQRILLQRTRENPGRVLMMLGLSNYFNWANTVMQSSFLSHLGNNPLNFGAFKFPSSVGDLATVNMGLSMFK